VDFSPEADQVEVELGRARRALQDAGGPDPDLEQRVAELVERSAAAYAQIKIRQIPPDDMQAIVDAHQPTDEQAKQGARWAPTFGPAVLAATVVDSDMSESDWAMLFKGDQLALGELMVLVNTAVAVNDRSPDVMWGKGSPPTIS
jgi:hypothetical protein